MDNFGLESLENFDRFDKKSLDKELSDFLKRFEENMIESNAEELRNQELNAENLEPMFDKNDLD